MPLADLKLGECLATSTGGSRWLSACKFRRSIARLNRNLVCRPDIYRLCPWLTKLNFHRRYKTPTFAEQLLNIIHALRMPVWCNHEITPQTVKIQKVSGSLTNAVYFVSNPSIPHLPTLLLRIYGPSSASLISRPRELHTLHLLSSQYHIGPKVYGTFENGRVEEYFESTALTAEDMRDPVISTWIGARMGELHQVDAAAIESQTLPATPMPSYPACADNISQIGVKKNIKSWIPAARDVLALPTVSEQLRLALDLDAFGQEWERYMNWVSGFEAREGASPVVFCHNDTQYGNLHRMTSHKQRVHDHRQVIFLILRCSNKRD